MPEYQGNIDEGGKVQRRKHFLGWVFVLGASLLLSLVLPLLGGLIRLDWQRAAGGVALALSWCLWPTVFFLLGMLFYAGALFEWRWFFHSRRLRQLRTMLGDQGARKFYLASGAC